MKYFHKYFDCVNIIRILMNTTDRIKVKSGTSELRPCGFEILLLSLISYVVLGKLLKLSCVKWEYDVTRFIQIL